MIRYPYRLKRKFKIIREKITTFFQKVNWLYVAMLMIIILGSALLISSCQITDNDLKNIAVGLGTGIVTSTLVTLYIEIINSKIHKRQIYKYKRMILNPLYNATKKLYIQVALSINEYRVRQELKGYLLLPAEDTKEMAAFFDEMKKVEIEKCEDEKKKKQIEDFVYVAPVFYGELISQYTALPFESLLIDNIISQEEYDKLKYFSIINECKKCYHVVVNVTEKSEQEVYIARLQLLLCSMMLMNRLTKIFDFFGTMVKSENKRLEEHLNDLYFYEIYFNSEEYIQRQIEEMEWHAEHMSDNPEDYETMEESAEDKLHRKINEAIWAGDAETIKKFFPQIDKDNKQIQSELTWSLAKDVMKDKELRKMYLEKYGVKYKVRKEKRRR